MTDSCTRRRGASACTGNPRLREDHTRSQILKVLPPPRRTRSQAAAELVESCLQHPGPVICTSRLLLHMSDAPRPDLRLLRQAVGAGGVGDN